MRRRLRIAPRVPVFLGCEGESERGYAVRLNQVADAVGLHIAVRTSVLQPGAGDPLELVGQAVVRVREFERKRDKLAVKAVLIDRGAPQKNREAEDLARSSGMLIIWQDPDHEAFLLRHLPRCLHLRPPPGTSFDLLCKHWPDYRKRMPAARLASRIGAAELRTVRTAEPGLDAFLARIGFR